MSYFQVVPEDGDGDAIEVVTREEYEALLAKNKALQAKLDEYDKYVAEFTNRA